MFRQIFIYMDFFLFFLPPFFPVCMPFLFLNKNGRLSKKMIINSSLGKEIGRLGNKSEREIDFWLCALLNCLFFPLFSFYHGMYYQLKKKISVIDFLWSMLIRPGVFCDMVLSLGRCWFWNANQLLVKFWVKQNTICFLFTWCLPLWTIPCT